MKKKWLINSIIVIVLITVIFLLPTSKAIKVDVSNTMIDENGNIVYTEENKKEGKPYLNPLWEEYISQSEEERSKWEIIPEKYLVDFVPTKKTLFSKVKSFFAEDEVLPEKYDLKDVNGKRYVGPTKNQSNLGLCWDFASVASLESNARLSGLGDLVFSERQIDYVTGEDGLIEGSSLYENGELGGGGSFTSEFIVANLTGVSPQLESDWGPYDTSKNKRSVDKVFDKSKVKYSIESAKMYPSFNPSESTEEVKQEYIEMIKKHIMQYGAIYVSAPTPDSRANYTYDHEIKTGETLDSIAKQYNTTKEAIMSLNNLKDENLTIGETIKVKSICYDSSQKLITYHKYCGKGVDSTHAMAIVGWDDNYGPNNEGAWILKNSWGSDNPIYLSYKSKYGALYGVTKIQNSNIYDYDNVYIKDWGTNKVGTINSGNDSYRYSRQYIYKSKEKEILKKIVYTPFAQYLYNDIDIYLSTTGKVEDLKFLKTIKSNFELINTIEFNDLELTSDKILIEFRNPYTNDYVSPLQLFVYTDDATDKETISSFIDYDNRGYGYKNYIQKTDKETTDFNIISNIKSINQGASLDIEIYDFNGNDVTDKFIAVNNFSIINGFQKSKFIFNNNEVNDGIYRIEVKYKDKVMENYPITLGNYNYKYNMFMIYTDSDYNLIYDSDNNEYIFKVIPKSNNFVNLKEFRGNIFLANTYNIYGLNSELITNANTNLKTGMTISNSNDLVTPFNVPISIKGDNNGDGLIDTGDVLKLHRYVLGTVKMDELYYKEASKINDDEEIDTGDVLRLHRYALGQIENL